MGLRQKFFFLATVAGFVVAIISVISYYLAYTHLSKSVEQEIQASVEVEKQSLETWLQAKLSSAISAANVMSSVDSNANLAKLPTLLSTGANDAEILTMAVGNEDGFIMTYSDGDISSMLDPRNRDWYKSAKSQGSPIFTEVYKDAVTGKQVVSIAVPYKNFSGNFRGAICEDVTLDVLNERAKNIHYHGEGFGYIVQSDGKILAASNPEETAEFANQSPILKDHFQTMTATGKGYFVAGSQVFGYTTIESTGWIILVSAPEEAVFAPIHDMQMKFGGLALFGIAIILFMMFICVHFSKRLLGSISQLQSHAQKMSQGVLIAKDIDVDSDDEMGVLGTAFNTMSHNIRELIQKASATAAQVAASSEELTSGAEQSAQSAMNASDAVHSLVMGLTEQEKSCNQVKKISDEVFAQVEDVTGQMARVLVETIRTQETAREGGELMHNAIQKMNGIEKDVSLAAEVVKKLGDNSQQIGEIIDTISGIADHTNLLALNAAIEAVRAGEQGKGFAVVADEVRKLATASQESAEKIRNLIQSLQENTEAAVKAMEGGTAEVRQGTEKIREVGSQFDSILEMVTTAKENIDRMAPQVAEMSRGAEKIVEAVEMIDEIAQQTSYNTQLISKSAEEQSATTEEIAAASQILANMAMELQEATNKFNV